MTSAGFRVTLAVVETSCTSRLSPTLLPMAHRKRQNTKTRSEKRQPRRLGISKTEIFTMSERRVLWFRLTRDVRDKFPLPKNQDYQTKYKCYK